MNYNVLVPIGDSMQEIKNQPLRNRGIKTKNNIIAVAFKSFFKNGYKKTTTIKIAKEAGVSIGIVYSYFKDKDELLELWLNSLLKKSDEYFYNQFKLRIYDVELFLIIGNILEKLCDSFFCSPIVNEKDEKLTKILNNFYLKEEKIFMNACNDSNIFVKHQNETAHIIFNLIKSYSEDLKNTKSRLNQDVLKDQYVISIYSLLK